jgi:hypothetical protein
MATVELRYSPQNSAWFTANATMILKAGEPAYHATTGQFKLGDGTTQLSALPFLPAASGGGSGVPYTGATGNVNLGEYQIRVGQMELDQSPTGTAGVAITRWNDSLGSTETTLKGGSVVLKNGVDLVARIVNKVTPNTTLTKAAYQVVKVSGAQGQRLAVGLAQANNDNNSADTLGIVTETIATNQEGFIICVGQIEEINTTGSLQGESWSDGDVLYLSPTTAGSITNIKPTGLTGHIVVLGYVEYSHSQHGKIYVKIMNGWELDELHNVYINTGTLANNDALVYDSASTLWKNKPLNSTTLTNGSVVFSNGTTLTQDNANLFWNDTTNRLGIGTNSPAYDLEVKKSTASNSVIANVQNTATTGYSFFQVLGDNNTTYSALATFNSAGGVGTFYDNNTSGITTNSATLSFLTNENATGGWVLTAGGYGTVNEKARFTISATTFKQAIATSGAVTTFTFTKPNNTGQTASTAINGFLFTLGNRQWATGAITTQKEFELTAPTYSFVGASTITNAYSLFVNKPTAGTNATITNNYAAGFNGNVEVKNDLVVGNPKFTIELVDALTVNFYNRYAMSIDSVTNILNSPTITILDDGAAYTLGNTIAIGSKITITASTASVVVLNATRI